MVFRGRFKQTRLGRRVELYDGRLTFKALVVAFLTVLTFQAHAVSPRTCRDLFVKRVNKKDLSAAFVKLVRRNQVLGQRDRTLDQRGLLIEDGGLCGLTCVTNILAVSAATPPRAETVETLVNLLKSEFGVDARKGVSFQRLARSADDLVLSQDAPLITHHHPIQATGGYTEDLLRPRLGLLNMIAVQSPRGSAHAVVLLELNVKTKTIRYSDPEYPRVILSVGYLPTIDAATGLATIALQIPKDGRLIPWTVFDLIEFESSNP